MNQPTTKQELLNEMERSHQDLVRVLASMSDEEKVAPILQDGWSVKDSLAHLVAWEKMTMDWLTRSLRGEHVKRFVEGFQYDTEEQREPVMQALNQHLFEQNKDRALADVMRDFRATHRAILQFVAQMDERDIFDPNRFAWRNGSPALDMIGGNTYDHYAEHQGWILEWRARRAYPTTKSELMRRIRERHAEMEELLASLSPAQLTAPELDAGWSVKDSLAHLAAWDNLAVDWTNQYRRGEAPKYWAEGFVVGDGNTEEHMHRFNAHLFEQNKNRALDEVLDHFRSAFLRAVETVESLDASEIFDADHFPARKGRPLIALLAGDSYEHYDEHLGWIRAWLAR
jgi:hypothetical protein